MIGTPHATPATIEVKATRRLTTGEGGSKSLGANPYEAALARNAHPRPSVLGKIGVVWGKS